MSDFDPATFASGDPKTFSKSIKSASKSELEAAMSGEHRNQILTDVFKQFPVVFRADRAGSTNAVIHWNITGAPDGGVDTYEVVISNATCTVNQPPQNEPKLALTTGGVEFLNLVSGNGNPMMLFMTGKLKAKGDISLAASIEKLFEMPKG